MELHLWFSLVIICILGALSPGPSLALVIKNTLNGGQTQGYKTAISHAFGVALYAAITTAGVAVILIKSPMMFKAIQYTGAFFLLYLGLKSLLTKKPITKKHNSQAFSQHVNGWRDGFLIAMLNPKLVMFFFALFSQFLTTDASFLQKVIMTLTVGGIDVLWYLLVVFMLSKGSVIAKLTQHHVIVDKITGVILIALAFRVVVA